jgi:hypothetical protein
MGMDEEGQTDLERGVRTNGINQFNTRPKMLVVLEVRTQVLSR